MLQFNMLIFSLGIIIAYLFGSLSSAIIFSRLFKLPDPRTQGSRNPGTTNILRIAGKKMAILVLLGDMLKGVIPVALASDLRFSTFAVSWIGLAAIFGHLFPIFFQFRGGKGVATAAGVLLAFSLPLGFAVMATWILVAFIFRYSSLAALTATITAPLYNLWLGHHEAEFAILLLSLLIILRHRENIYRLLKGTETKIGAQK